MQEELKFWEILSDEAWSKVMSEDKDYKKFIYNLLYEEGPLKRNKVLNLIVEKFGKEKYTQSNAMTDIAALHTWGIIDRIGRGDREILNLTRAGENKEMCRYILGV